MAGRSWYGLAIVVLSMAACTNTFIDLTPDGEDSVGVDDGEPDADVADTAHDGDGTIVLPPPPCGNGVVEPDEECDDLNRIDDDGCTWECLFGPGDPVGPPDPAVRPYKTEGLPLVLPPVAQPPEAGAGTSEEPFMPVAISEGRAAITWPRNPPVIGSPPQLSTRFLGPDGSLVHDDVVIGLMSGWTVWQVASAALLDDVLLVWQAGPHGLWRAVVSATGGLAVEPAQLDPSDAARDLALASAGAGFAMAWYEGTDVRPCEHAGPDASRFYLRRLGPDGSTDGMGDAVVLEEPLAARTTADLAAGEDGSVGLLWWRASPEASGSCSLRFGVADAGLTRVLDGGTVGPGRGGRIVDAENGYAAAWHDVPLGGVPQIGVASFALDAHLAAAPVVHEMPFDSFFAGIELAAGDHGLVVVTLGSDDLGRPRLFFFRTDLLGRLVGEPAAVREVDPTCTWDLNCAPGPFNVVWSGDAFLVIYFVTRNPTGSPTTEMRMVRLVPEV
jgi:cysteine-rich repeat protein